MAAARPTPWHFSLHLVRNYDYPTARPGESRGGDRQAQPAAAPPKTAEMKRQEAGRFSQRSRPNSARWRAATTAPTMEVDHEFSHHRAAGRAFRGFVCHVGRG